MPFRKTVESGCFEKTVDSRIAGEIVIERASKGVGFEFDYWSELWHNQLLLLFKAFVGRRGLGVFA